MAPWTLIENFEGLNPGNLTGQNGWTGATSTQVIADPHDEENQVMRFAPGGGHEAKKVLDPAIAAEGVSTLFFRIHIPAGSGRINQQLRLPTQSNVRLKVDTLFGSSSTDSLLQIFDADNNNREEDFIADRDTWYLMWLALDYEAGTAEWWIRGGSAVEPVRMLMVNVENPEDVFFAGQTIPDLVFVGWNNGPVLYDDLYIFHGAKRLDDPRAAAGVNSPLETWLEDNGLEDAEEEVMIDGAAYRAGDLFIMGARRENDAWTGLLYGGLSVSEAGQEITLAFQAVAGRQYHLQTRARLDEGGWEDVPHSQLQAETDQMHSFPLMQPEDSAFYRIRVAIP